jgi:hypothetical protein
MSKCPIESRQNFLAIALEAHIRHCFEIHYLTFIDVSLAAFLHAA